MPEPSLIQSADPRRNRPEFVYRVWLTTCIIVGVGLTVLVLWLAFKVVLLFLASVLFGIFLCTLTDRVGRMTHLPRHGAFALTLLVLVCLLGLSAWLLATPVATQVDLLSHQLPGAMHKLSVQLHHVSWLNGLLDRLKGPSGISTQAGELVKELKALFSISFSGVVDLWVVLFCGSYLALQPGIYLDGALKLVPTNRREAARRVLQEIGSDLRHWLFGQIVSMAIMGCLTGLGLFFLGIPGAVVLGMFTGLLDFIPVAGPWISGAVSCLLAFVKSPMHVVYVVCLFTGLHFIEAHLVIPLLQRHATRLPPALSIMAMVLFFTLFRFLGLVLALPLLALVLAIVRALYLQTQE